MNVQLTGSNLGPNSDEVAEALAMLRRWATTASAAEIASLGALGLLQGTQYPELARDYPADFAVDEAYKASLPDLQNGPSSLIKGAKQQIQHVGISNFR